MRKKKALIGFKCDEGVRRNKGRVGASLGPDAIRKYLDADSCNFIDLGDISCGENDFTAGHKSLQKMVFEQLEKGFKPVIIGGGHDMSYSNFVGAVNFLRTKQLKPNIAIVNIDPHLDIRDFDTHANSGTSFAEAADFCERNDVDFHYYCLGLNIDSNADKLIEKAASLHVKYALDSDEDQVLQLVDTIIANHDYIYLSLDMDVFMSSIAPGVSAPAKRGWTKEFVALLINKIIDSEKIILADIAELNPTYDVGDKTAKLAAYFTCLFLTS